MRVAIEELWSQMRDAVDKTYAERPDKENDHDADCLRDYARDISWSDDLAALLGREAANERQHRRTRSVRGFSVQVASKLILLNNVAQGARMKEMPKATAFLTFRQTAVEAEVIGWLCRENLTEAWHDAVATWDYAEQMKNATAV